uniref:Porin n=1 Tax=Haemonchus placei TaxID=6290 RepID=A0A0N4VWB5_HAEPC
LIGYQHAFLQISLVNTNYSDYGFLPENQNRLRLSSFLFG